MARSKVVAQREKMGWVLLFSLAATSSGCSASPKSAITPGFPNRRGAGCGAGTTPSGSHVFDYRARPENRRARRRRSVALVHGRAARRLGRSRRRSRCHAVVRRPRLRQARPRFDASRAQRTQGAALVARRRRGSRRQTGGDDRCTGARAGAHRKKMHRRRRSSHRQGLLRPGQLDDERQGLAGDVARLRGVEGDSGGATAPGARRCREGRA